MPPAEPAPPLSDDEVDTLLTPLRGASGLALAVSGGADSLALLLCVERWRRRGADTPVCVLTVDHGLRPEAADEAAMVAGVAASRGLPCDVLTWDGPHPTSDIEAAARHARYRLLIGAAVARGASHLLLAHHQDDVAETVLLRLARGAGVFGLAAMRPLIPLEPVTLVRPFLSVPRSRLLATTRQAGLRPATDPMNNDPRFARARLRALMPTLAAAGVDANGLAATAHRLADAADAIDVSASDVLCTAASFDPFGVIRMQAEIFIAAPKAVRYRALGRILSAAGGAGPWSRFERLARLEDAIAGGGVWQRSLSGVLISSEDGTVTFRREAGRTPLPEVPVTKSGEVDWDQRFRLVFTGEVPPDTVVGSLGEDRRQIPAPKAAPAAVLATLPAVRVAGKLRLVPTVGHDEGPEPRVAVRCLVEKLALTPPLFPDFMA